MRQVTDDETEFIEKYCADYLSKFGLRQDLDDNRHYSIPELADLHGLTAPEFSTLLQGFTPLPHSWQDGLRGWQLKMMAYWREHQPVMRQHKPAHMQYVYAH